ncbi:helix-hairpin-helix domain-containing protein [Butyrivibrio sp. AE3004]|uniref:helix-hairpin-helix domain-containing protein n=1 Tax=Butyrivibrio sp. AE3004 TaxID=1506994 RepID=UPI00068A816F|nr:helix-hairpin-helix domain-containing protein [Butyrivibrio sp. AE3004]
MQKNITNSFIFLILVGSIMVSGCNKKSTDVVLTEPACVLTESGAADVNSFETGTENVDAGSNDAATTEENTSKTDSPYEQNEQKQEDQPVIPENIMVHVCGAVLCEGVYELPAGSRVVDAIRAAGGLLEEADSNYVNQALVLEDGVKVKIPTLEESALLPEEESGIQASSTTGDAGISGMVPNDKASEDSKSSKVNINTAGEDELCSIPGIGPSRAKNIIAYREENGRFGTIEDIKRVSGIKDKFFSKIKDHITV